MKKEPILAGVILVVILMIAGTAIILSGCAPFMARSYYEVNYTFVTPASSSRDEVVTGKVGGEGLTHSRVLVEFPRAFKLLIDELRGKRK